MSLNMVRLLVKISSFIAIIAILLAPVAYAQTTLISPIGNTKQASGPAEYISTIFLYGIGFAALVAVFQLVFGAVQYTMSAGMPSLQESSKERMRSAIVGLIILLVAFSGLLLINRNFNVLSNPNLEDVPPPQEDPGVRRDRLLNELAGNAREAAAQLGERYGTLHGMGIFGENALDTFLDERADHWYNRDTLEKNIEEVQGYIDSVLREAALEGEAEREWVQQRADVAFRYLLEWPLRRKFFQDETGQRRLRGQLLGATREEYFDILREVDGGVDPRYYPQIMD